MEYSVYAYDVQHIILDNLQFLMGTTYSGYERFDAQEKALHEFRKFATTQNVHVTLVIHPRKEPEEQALNISSVFGTAKATQEADNVIILQNENGHKRIEIKKNRFDGDLGNAHLFFNRQRLVFEEKEDKSDTKPKENTATQDAPSNTNTNTTCTTNGVAKKNRQMGKTAHEIIVG